MMAPYFCNYFFLEKYLASNLNKLCLRMICNKFDKKWPAGSAEENF
jgi:hypothetical protein